MNYFQKIKLPTIIIGGAMLVAFTFNTNLSDTITKKFAHVFNTDIVSAQVTGEGTNLCYTHANAIEFNVPSANIVHTFRVSPQNDATCTSITAPASVSAGGTFSATVTMTNTGQTTWTAADNYKLGSQALQDNTRWGTGRVALSETNPLVASVPTGASVTFSRLFTAPAATGVQAFNWKMLREGVEWFGGTCVMSITVTPASTNLVSEGLNVPNSGTKNSPLNFSATVRNSGSTNVGAFNDRFSYSWTSATGPWTDLPNIAKATLTSGGTSGDTDSYTPTQTGSLYVQHCVDSTNVIAEGADETPNCTTSSGSITVVDSVPVPTVTVRACNLGGGNCVTSGVKTISSGSEVQIEWSSTDATSCSATLGTGFTAGALSGTDNTITEPAVGATDIFRVRCIGPGGSAINSAAVQTISGGAPPTLTATPPIVNQGSQTTLTWTLSGQTCTLNGGTYNNVSLSADGSFTPVINANTTFTLTCPSGTVTTTVEIIPSGFET